MARTAARNMGECEGDRISNLPSHITDNILKWLSMRDAVRTSILSRPWRYKWVTIPHLVFDFSFPAKKPSQDSNNIESIIHKILALHQGPILKFSVETHDFRIRHKAVDHWLYCLSSHPIEELIINCLDPPCHPISHHLFAFDHLRHLYLVNFEVRLPSTFKGFGGLVQLHLYNVNFAPGEFRIFLSKCPMLESLILMDTAYEITCGDLGRILMLLISSPLASHHAFSFKNAPLLAEITVLFSSYDFMFDDSDPSLSVISGIDEYKNYLIKFMHGLSSLTTLVLGGCFLQFLGVLGLPEKLPHDLNSLRILKFPDVYFRCLLEVSCAVCFIRSAPNLQSLEIKFSASDDLSGMESTSEFLMKMRTQREFTLSRLEYVKIDCVIGWEHEMEFVKLLLSAATALRKLEIRFNDPWRAEGNHIFMKELLSFHPASPEAQLIFQNSILQPFDWGVMNSPGSCSCGSVEEVEDEISSGSSVPVEDKTDSPESCLSGSSVHKSKERMITSYKNVFLVIMFLLLVCISWLLI